VDCQKAHTGIRKHSAFGSAEVNDEVAEAVREKRKSMEIG